MQPCTVKDRVFLVVKLLMWRVQENVFGSSLCAKLTLGTCVFQQQPPIPSSRSAALSGRGSLPGKTGTGEKKAGKSVVGLVGRRVPGTHDWVCFAQHARGLQPGAQPFNAVSHPPASSRAGWSFSWSPPAESCCPGL